VMLRMSVERESGYLSWLGVRMDDLQYGEAQLTVPFEEKLADSEASEPVVHNGITTTLMEQVGELAVRTRLDDPVNDTADLLSVDVTVLDDAVHDLVARAEAIDGDDATAVATVDVESRTPDGTRATVATGRGIHRTG
jgi:hypothetical protein